MAWLQALGIAPTDHDVAIAALAISIEDWRRELKRSQRKQRPAREPLYPDDED